LCYSYVSTNPNMPAQCQPGSVPSGGIPISPPPALKG